MEPTEPTVNLSGEEETNSAMTEKYISKKQKHVSNLFLKTISIILIAITWVCNLYL